MTFKGISAGRIGSVSNDLGYKNVYVCVDTTATDGSGHCWAEIGGRVYDPLFAEAKSYYGYFGVGYGSYGLYPERRVAV